MPSVGRTAPIQNFCAVVLKIEQVLWDKFFLNELALQINEGALMLRKLGHVYRKLRLNDVICQIAQTDATS